MVVFPKYWEAIRGSAVVNGRFKGRAKPKTKAAITVSITGMEICSMLMCRMK